MRITHSVTLFAGAVALFLSGCGGGKDELTAKRVDTEAIMAAKSTPEVWLTHGGTYDEQRHSMLDSINEYNVGGLGVAWTYDLRTGRGVESTPIVVDGVMYVTSAWSVVHALDAKTGKELWVYDPQVDRAVGINACCDVVNRGVAVYKGNLYLGVIDGRLEALNAKNGKVIWSTVTVDQSKPYTITGAPRVVKDKVLIGNGGAELGVRGYISAYDAKYGDLVWRFYTVPNPKKEADGAASDSVYQMLANDTWGDDGAWVTDGGGGTVWDSIVYDEVHDRVIFGVGNGSPWNQIVRDPTSYYDEFKDNLFLSSIVAVDAETGEYAWHFQTTPGDNWDYTATQTIILADLPFDNSGETRRVAMQAPKNGFFYVIDAENGEFISGKDFVPITWATGLDMNGRPIESPNARYTDIPIMTIPGPLGAHNWHPMAFSPVHNLAYIPAQQIPQAYANDPRFTQEKAFWNTGADFSAGAITDVTEDVLTFVRSGIKGSLIAWDPVTQTERWVVDHENAWNGGVLSTQGNLVFQGKLGGDFVAYKADTGEKLWSYDVKSGAASGPGTYSINGEQYVTITTGWGSAFALAAGLAYKESVPPSVGKVVTFKLGGNGEIQAPDLPMIDKTPKARRFGSTADIEEGLVHYARNCAVCHGLLAVSSGVLPDLRWSDISGDAEAWNSVILEGNLRDNGMVAFDFLTRKESEAIRAYIVDQAHRGASGK